MTQKRPAKATKTKNQLQKELNEELKIKHGLTVKQITKLAREKARPKSKKLIIKEATKEFTFGVVTDTHLCSTLCNLDQLHAFYDICSNRGISDVLHAGDMLAGNGKMFRGQLSEMTCYGFEAQAEEVIENYPKKDNITTHAIAGNHDLSFYNDNGADVLKTITESRKDINYLGHYSADIVLNGVKIKLLHPDKGGSYAISYKSQKMVEQMDQKNKPDILILGHWHTALYFKQCDVHVIHGGCWETQGDYLIRKGITSTVGGWIVTVRMDSKGKLQSVIPEFVSFN